MNLTPDTPTAAALFAALDTPTLPALAVAAPRDGSRPVVLRLDGADPYDAAGWLAELHPEGYAAVAIRVHGTGHRLDADGTPTGERGRLTVVYSIDPDAIVSAILHDDGTRTDDPPLGPLADALAALILGDPRADQ